VPFTKFGQLGPRIDLGTDLFRFDSRTSQVQANDQDGDVDVTWQRWGFQNDTGLRERGTWTLSYARSIFVLRFM
jgi:hypothetical protein